MVSFWTILGVTWQVPNSSPTCTELHGTDSKEWSLNWLLLSSWPIWKYAKSYPCERSEQHNEENGIPNKCPGYDTKQFDGDGFQ